MMNKKRVGIGISVRSPSITPFCRRMKAVIGLTRKSTSPTRTFDASEFAGSFFMKPVSCGRGKLVMAFIQKSLLAQ